MTNPGWVLLTHTAINYHFGDVLQQRKPSLNNHNLVPPGIALLRCQLLLSRARETRGGGVILPSFLNLCCKRTNLIWRCCQDHRVQATTVRSEPRMSESFHDDGCLVMPRNHRLGYVGTPSPDLPVPATGSPTQSHPAPPSPL